MIRFPSSLPSRSAIVAVLAIVFIAAGAQAGDWLHWRGPQQIGVSAESGLPTEIAAGGAAERWTVPIAGRGTPVIAAGLVYALGYRGEGKDLQEVLLCIDERTGETRWEHAFNDFLSDVIYDRYAIGSPTVDAQTGCVYVMSTAGELCAFTRDGRLLWKREMLSEFGRITFPNGRTGAPIVDEDRVIIHIISAHWGPVNGPANDRFYAFDKMSGDVIWICTPGDSPKDSSFSAPYLSDEGGRRMLYAGTGCGHVVCIDSRTGDPVWRYKLATGGINSACFRYRDSLIVIHGKENIDISTIGAMVALDVGARPEPGEPGPVELDKSAEQWRNDLVAFTSSPVPVGDRVYETTANGDLCAVNADTGAVLWHHKLAPDQIHASPAFGDGKLYVPMNNGSFYVIRPADNGPEILSQTQLEGNCLGAPAIADGRVYVHTTAKLYCFGAPEDASDAAPEPVVSRIQVIPSDLLLRQGERVDMRVRGLDENGKVVMVRMPGVEWSMKGAAQLVFEGDEIMAPTGGRTGVGFVTATVGDLQTRVGARVVASLPYVEDFESIALDQTAEDGSGAFGFPPGFWIGARLKFDVRELDGGKVLAKTLDNNLFQRATAMIGEPDMSNYTISVDIRTDGNRRSLSTAGVINQRYMVQLKGNHQEIEVSSNMERLKETVPFRWKANVWYTLTTRVDVAADGSGVVRAKVWPRDEAEPEAWTIEVTHQQAHRHGSPGIFGFSPQSRFRVYLDNLQVIPND